MQKPGMHEIFKFSFDSLVCNGVFQFQMGSTVWPLRIIALKTFNYTCEILYKILEHNFLSSWFLKLNFFVLPVF